MTSREAIRTAVVIGGLWLIFSALAAVPDLLQALLLSSEPRGSGLDLPAFTRLFFWPYLPVLLGLVLLGIIPGIYLVSRGQVWADRLSPRDGAEAELGPSLILYVSVMVFGFSLGVRGFIELTTSGLALAAAFAGVGRPASLMEIYGVQSVHGLISLVAGIWSFRWGSQGVLRAA